MVDEQWQTIKRLFFEARDLPEAERAKFLEKACEGRDAIRNEVEALLASHDKPDSFLVPPERGDGARRVEHSPQLESGTILGPYEVRAPLGAGGMGEIYRGLDRRLDREVALKILPRELASDPAALARFHREARLLASVSHPNLVPIYDVGHEREVDFLVMELVEGETLRSYLLREPMKPQRAVAIAVAMARALDAAHKRGIVHRDLKPENVLIDSGGRVRVLDFGLARETPPAVVEEVAKSEHITRRGTVLGTPGYMAPEQVRGEVADERTDLFALGCVLYEMLVGVRPFSGPTPADAVTAVLRDEPPLPPADAVEPWLTEIVARCLEKDRSRRPASAEAVVRELEERIASHGPDGTTEKPRHRTSRRWHAAGLGVGLGLLALVGILARTASEQPDPSLASVRRVAVLPVVDDTADPESSARYLADGVTEAWIHDLSRLQGLRVISRASVMQYRDQRIDPTEVAGELDVDAVLLGEMRPASAGLTLSAELVDGTTGHVLWGSARTGAARELGVLHGALITELMGRLVPGRQPGGDTREEARVNPEAYRLYLQGRYQWNRRDPEGLRSAIRSFQEALAIDPTYARAYVGLADTYNVMHNIVNLPPSETFPRARRAAERALALAPDLPEARVSLANVKHYWEWDWSSAEADYRAALARNPSYATGWQFYSELLTTLGRFDEAYEAVLRAQELDPLSAMVHAITGWNLEMARRFELAISHQRRNLEVFPGFNPAKVYLGRALVQAGRADEGVEIFEEDVAALPDRPIHRCWLAWAYAVADRRREARAQLEELYRIRSGGQFVLPYYLAYPHIALGELDRALELLDESVEQRLEQVVWLGVDPTLDPLRDHPRFLALLERTGLGEVQRQLLR